MANISISSLIVGSLTVNCWFLVNEDSKEVLVFDPGAQAEKIKEKIDNNAWTVKAILLTHGHGDHMGAANQLRELYKVPIYAMKEEEEVLLDAKKNLSVFIDSCKAITVKADEFLQAEQEITLAGISLKAYWTPGHTIGGASYYCEAANCLISGDTLFCASIGRSDFPTGSSSALVRSVREKLFLLPDDTKVCPGHGEESTIGYEKKYNPFVQ